MCKKREVWRAMLSANDLLLQPLETIICMRNIFLFLLLSLSVLHSTGQTITHHSVVGMSLGLGNLRYGRTCTTKVPPLTASYEYMEFADVLGIKDFSLGLGGRATFTAVQSVTQYGKAELTSRISELLTTVSVSGHYPFIPDKRWDTYATILLGWGIAGNKNSWKGDEETIALAKSLGWENQEKVGGPFFGIMAGCGYWFTECFAGNVEIGYGSAFLNIGACYRF